MSSYKKLTVGSLKNRGDSVSESKEVKSDDGTNNKSDKDQVKEINEKIKVIQNNQEYTVTPKQERKSLLDMALEQEQPLDYKCKKGTCGRCKIEVVDRIDLLEPKTGQEKKMLKGLGEEVRLACQSVVNID